MARYPRLDPEYPKGVRLTTKLAVPDAERIRRLAEQAGVTRSEYLRSVVIDALGRADTRPGSTG
jgi:hypothetical protein